MASNNNVVDAEFRMEETEVIETSPEGVGETMDYDQFVDTQIFLL